MTPDEIAAHVGPDAASHPAWDSFCEQMRDRQYGWDPVTQAWFWYRLGWAAAPTEEPTDE